MYYEIWPSHKKTWNRNVNNKYNLKTFKYNCTLLIHKYVLHVQCDNERTILVKWILLDFVESIYIKEKQNTDHVTFIDHFNVIIEYVVIGTCNKYFRRQVVWIIYLIYRYILKDIYIHINFISAPELFSIYL